VFNGATWLMGPCAESNQSFAAGETKGEHERWATCSTGKKHRTAIEADTFEGNYDYGPYDVLC
jgi:hypothetical protein